MSRSIHQFFPRTKTGNTIPGAEYTVKDAVTGSSVDIFESKDSESPKTMPYKADGNGKVSFYIEPGIYNIDSTDLKTGNTGSKIDVPIGVSRRELSDNNGVKQFDKTYATVADMKADTSLQANGSKLINTVDYYSTQRGGGASYLIKTTAQATADGDVYSASTKGNILLGNGNVAVLQQANKTLTSLQFGSGLSDDAQCTKELIERGLKDDVDKVILDVNLTSAVAVSVSDDSELNITGKIVGTGGVAITANTLLSTTCGATARKSNTLTVLDSTGFTVGDYIKLVATIEQEDYTPDRFLDLEFVAKISKIAGNVITLDRRIEYKASAGVVELLPDVKIGFDLIQVDASFSVNSVTSVHGKSIISGERPTGSGSQFNSVYSSADVDLSLTLNQAIADLCLVHQNITSGTINVNSIGSGADAGSKAHRANALQAVYLNGNFQQSRVSDSIVYACRNCKADYISDGNGQLFRESGDVSGNRNNALQWGESDECEVNANITNADDQAAEFIGMRRGSKLSGYFDRVTDKPTTEGAVVIKGFSDDVDVDIRANGRQGHGLKLEYFDGMTNIRVSKESYVQSADNVATILRDATGPHDTKTTIRGTHKAGLGGEGLQVRPDHNNVNIDVSVDLSIDEPGVNVQSSGCHVEAKGINEQSEFNRVARVAESGNTFGSITGKGICQLTGNGRSDFSFSKFSMVGIPVSFEGDGVVLTRSAFGFTSSNLPVSGSFVDGDFLWRETLNAPGGGKIQLGWRWRTGVNFESVFVTNV